MPPLVVENRGPLILGSNYWDLPECALGKVLVSCNAGAFRLLWPPSLEPSLPDLGAATGCAVSRGPWPGAGLADAFEVLFDDGTSDPFAVHLSPESFDRLPAAADFGRRFTLSVWTRPRRGVPHRAVEKHCVYRRSPGLPDLRPWQEV